MAKQEKETYTLQELDELINQGKFYPLYYFYGDNDYLIDEYTKTIIDKNVEESIKSFNVDILDANNIKMGELISIASAYPMNNEKRVVVVRQFKKLLSSEDNNELFLRYVKNPLDSTILILIGEKLDMRTTLAQQLKKNCVIVEFKALYDNQVPDWIKKQVKYFNKTITDSAARLMADYIGNSMREINAELEKLCLFINDKHTIDVDDVVAVVGMSKSYNVFALQKAIGERRISDALFILENMLNRGESAIGIIAILTKYFHKLWTIRSANLTSAGIMKVFKMQQFAADEYERCARNFSVGEIETAILQLMKADENLKTSNIDEKLVMTLLIYSILEGKVVL